MTEKLIRFEEKVKMKLEDVNQQMDVLKDCINSLEAMIKELEDYCEYLEEKEEA